MKKILIATCGIIMSMQVFAQINFRTGDDGLEKHLNMINLYARAHSSEYWKELAFDYKMDEQKLLSMSKENKMEPADVYMVVELAALANKTPEEIIVLYKLKGKGWGTVIKQLGYKPDSDDFHSLKHTTKLKAKAEDKIMNPDKAKKDSANKKKK
jgi:hypothetical protein